MANLDSLPPEVLSFIFRSVGTCNCNVSGSCPCARGTWLKSAFNLRLTSTKFASIGERSIVETIHLCYRKKSFQNLERISESQTLRKHVRRITYETDALGYLSRENWERCIAIPRHIPLPAGIRCLGYLDSERDKCYYMPGKHWERCCPAWPREIALPSDVAIPPYAQFPNFASSLPENAGESDLAAIVTYNRTRKIWMKKLPPRLIYTEEELDHGYECFFNEVKENRAFLSETDHDYTILAKALKKFPLLDEVKIVTLLEESSGSEDLRAAFKHTLVFPCQIAGQLVQSHRLSDGSYLRNRNCRQIQSLMQGLASAGIQLETLTCGSLKRCPESFWPLFTSLKHIEIQLNTSDWKWHMNRKDFNLGKAIATAQGLTSLTCKKSPSTDQIIPQFSHALNWIANQQIRNTVCFNWNDYYQNEAETRLAENLLHLSWNRIAMNTKWTHLTTLSLSGLAMTESFWIDFFQKHSSTLVSLDLDTITMVKGHWPNTFVRMKSIVKSTNRLRKAKFNRTFFHREDAKGQEIQEVGFNMSFSTRFRCRDCSLGDIISRYLVPGVECLVEVFEALKAFDEKVYPGAIRSYGGVMEERFDATYDTDSNYSYDEVDDDSEWTSDDEKNMDLFEEDVAIEKSLILANGNLAYLEEGDEMEIQGITNGLGLPFSPNSFIYSAD